MTLRGSGFAEPAEVFFNDVSATNVVVLDQFSIAASTPAQPPGPATVKVITAAGEDELVDGFIYHRELLLENIDPPRIPDEGGVLVTVTGKGFDDKTVVLFDRNPLRGIQLVDETTLAGYAPALMPGRPEVLVFPSRCPGPTQRPGLCLWHARH